jgi:hypothetical protein
VPICLELIRGADPDVSHLSTASRGTRGELPLGDIAAGLEELSPAGGRSSVSDSIAKPLSMNSLIHSP